MCAGSVSALMTEFRSVKLKEVDKSGRNPRDDRHYFGLVRSVVIGVQRMVAACRDEGEKEDAVGLLMAMSLLHGSETPVRLFRGEAALPPMMIGTLRTIEAAMEMRANSVARVPPSPLKWLVDLIQMRIKDYTAAAAGASTLDASIASTPTQVWDGEEWSCRET